MSYPLDLDEMDEAKILDELVLRSERRLRRLCDYCGRDPNQTVSCKFPDRHVMPLDGSKVECLAKNPAHERTTIVRWHLLRASQAEFRAQRAIGEARTLLVVEADTHRAAARQIAGLAHWEG